MKTTFATLIGQPHIKRQLDFYGEAAAKGSATPFLLFEGARGLGKTEFARKFAKGLKKPLLEINCSTIKNNSQFFEQIFVPIVMNNEVTLLLDECHALPKDLVMAFLTVFNTEAANRKHFEWEGSSMEFDFQKQTYLFATTEPDKLFAPFKDRLTIVDFKPYSEMELGQILKSRVDWVSFEDGVIEKICDSLRGNARSAVKRSKEIAMYCEAKNKSLFGLSEWSDLCHTISINENGLSNSEIQVLQILKSRGPSTLNMLSAATGLSRTAIQRDVEIYLLRKGFMKIDGMRHITSFGIEAIKSL
jgi:Holliday junction resolvasome RuvABC ATP-dependent DNA helicase subunit